MNGKRSLGLVLGLFCFVILACGSRAGAVRPDSPTFADVTHSSSCKIAPGRNEPFIVDWPAEKRADLEALTKQNIVAVEYGCDSLRILPECRVDGGYRFIGVTEKEESIKLEDSEEVRANLPFSGSTLAGKLGADLARGSSVDIGFAIVGKRVSTRRDIARSSLHGDCSGATHFVHATTVGAFAMSVGTRATMRAAADVFAVTGPTNNASRLFQHRQDGDLAACHAADSDAEQPPRNCGAPIRLELLALDEAAGPASGKELDIVPVVCPTGLVPTDDGKCAHASEKAHLCNWAQAADCELQCTRGSAISCSLYARRLQLGDGVPRDVERAARLYDKACKDNVMPACGRLGESLLASKHDEGAALLQKSCKGGWFEACTILATSQLKSGPRQDVFTLFKRGCDAGSAESCWQLGQLFTQGLGVQQNDGEAIKYYALACDGGAKLGCVDYAKSIDLGKGTPSDPARAAKLLEASCDRGFSDACASLASMAFLGRGVDKDPARGIALLQRACDGTDKNACFTLGMRYRGGMQVPRDPDRARVLFETACAAGFEIACAAAKSP